MNNINAINAETRLKAQSQQTDDHLAAILIAVYSMPPEARTPVLEKYYHNLQTMMEARVKKALIASINPCQVCQGDGYIDIDGDAGEHGWDKIGEKPCPLCYPEFKKE